MLPNEERGGGQQDHEETLSTFTVYINCICLSFAAALTQVQVSVCVTFELIIDHRGGHRFIR